MTTSLLIGAVVGASFQELLKAVLETERMASMFKPTLAHLRSTLLSIEPVIDQLERALDHRPEALASLIAEMQQGTDLVRKCSKIRRVNIYARARYQAQLMALAESLVRFFTVDLQALTARDLKETLLEVRRISSAISKLPLVSAQDTTTADSASHDAATAPVEAPTPRDLEETLLRVMRIHSAVSKRLPLVSAEGTTTAGSASHDSATAPVEMQQNDENEVEIDSILPHSGPNIWAKVLDGLVQSGRFEGSNEAQSGPMYWAEMLDRLVGSGRFLESGDEAESGTQVFDQLVEIEEEEPDDEPESGTSL